MRTHIERPSNIAVRRHRRRWERARLRFWSGKPAGRQAGAFQSFSARLPIVIAGI